MVSQREFIQVTIAFFMLAIVISFRDLVTLHWIRLGTAFLFAAIIIIANIGAKKVAARALDANVEHEIWRWSRFGFKPGRHTSRELPEGVILPALITAISLGTLRCMTLLTYETSALKRRAARRFGYYSFTEMTDWHNALVGAAGILGTLLIATASYFLVPSLAGLPSIATYYALWNLIPFSKLDGAQIFFGSRVLYTAIVLITLVMTLATLAIA